MEKHVYRCVACGHSFESEKPRESCPECRGKILVHEAGESRRKGKSLSG
jgi:DNA-directed RNA polymerase subunit RPC12/RpoP